MMKTYRAYTTILAITMLLGSCQRPDPALKEAATAIEQMATPPQIGRSCFYVIYPQGKPSDFLESLVSYSEVVDLPMAADERDAKHMKLAGLTPFPQEVSLSYQKRYFRAEKELVVLADNENQQIILRGYLPNQDSPNFEQQVTLVQTTLEEGVAESCRAKIKFGSQ